MSEGSSAVTIGLLGPVAVDTGRGMVEIAGTRARRLLAALTLQPGIVRSASVLIDLVWSDAQPKSPQSALHTQISRLRQTLPEGMIAAGSAGYRLDLTGHAVDVDRARSLIDDGTAGALDDAARLWRGVPGDDLGDDDLAAEVRAVGDGLRRRLDERRCRVALENGDHETARRVAQSLCDHDPLDEPAHLLLMRALQGAGRTNDALAVHARLRRALSSELGVDPGAEIAALHREILEGPTAAVAVPTASPAGRTARGSTGLRAEPNKLLGRATDIEDLLAGLRRHRVVSIVGPGGAGKTRLAQAVGRRVADESRSVLVVELASVRTDDDVVGAVAAALGVGEIDLAPGGRPLIPVGDLSSRLVDALTGRSALLILDNCEQIIDGCARVVSDLLAAVADLTVLTTSRGPLRIAGESVHRLGPLSIDGDSESPATDLFVARATAVRPDVVIDRDTVAQLCRDLDGLPLAIELAAARVRTMAVADIARLLSERLTSGRLTLLRSGDRTAPDRHRTLQAVIDWSWDLLDDPSRSALRRLCRFPAGFSSDAAVAVLGPALGDDPFAVDDALDALVDQSLLTVTETSAGTSAGTSGRVRYRMLEMVREFGEERLAASGEGADVNGAMARWAAHCADDIRSRYEFGDHSNAMADVIADADNLVWVLRRCTDPEVAGRPTDAIATAISVFPALAGSWIARGLHVEVRNWSPRIVDLLAHPPSGLDHHERELWQASLEMAAGHLMMLSTDPRALARAMIGLRALQDPDAVMTRRADFIGAIMLSRRPFAALRVISRGCRSQTPEVRAIALSVRSNARENSGDLRGALADSLLAQELATERGDMWITAMGSMEIASIHGQSGRYGEAVGYYRTAAVKLAELGADEEVAQVECYLLCSLIGSGAIDEARALLDEISDGWSPDQPLPQGVPQLVAGTLIGVAELALQSGDDATAAEVAGRLVRYVLTEHARATQDPSMLLSVSAGVALLTLSGAGDTAREHLPALATLLTTQFMPAGFRDLPQTGAGAIAVGAALCRVHPGSDDGARLMAMGARLQARRDYPALGRIRAEMAELSGMPAAAWESMSATIDRMPRRVCVENILSILDQAVPQEVSA
ncbi:BTAD domain-containing putative transcriptional regulator [Williamsia sp.]|uniref:BTAD domain-containing putative transcriptional regulator n=1 Tax=Williamsia sp. TaxID=1872085 RepID=UPI001A338F5F|nr:BTAD domain-containing putative transcriptional regulator [Williamsia sp.]MBJ7289884.1 AfsR/SARP family transcriptional regulator [Williamsia sp.]